MHNNDNFINFKEIIVNNKLHFNLKMLKFRINGIIDSNYEVIFNCVLIKSMYALLLMNSTSE